MFMQAWIPRSLKVSTVILTVLFLMSALSTEVKAQQKHKDLFNLTSVSLLIYDADIQVNNLQTELEADSLRKSYSGGFGIETIVGRYLSDVFSLGLGVGYNSYPEIELNTMPLFLDIRLWSKELSTPFVYGKLGGLVRLNENFGRGTFLEGGAGIRFLASDNIAMKLSAFYSASGISFTNQPYTTSDKTTDNITVGFSLGIFF